MSKIIPMTYLMYFHISNDPLTLSVVVVITSAFGTKRAVFVFFIRVIERTGIAICGNKTTPIVMKMNRLFCLN